MNKIQWYSVTGIHVFALGVVEGLNPYWPVWLAQRIEPNTNLYSVYLAALYSLPVLGAAISTTFWGRFTCHYNPFINWIRSLFGLGGSLILIALVPYLLLVLVLRFVQGLVASVLPASQHLVLQLDFDQGLFRLQSATAIASIIGPLWVGWLLVQITFTQTMFYTGLALIISASLALGAVLYIKVGKTKGPTSKQSTSIESYQFSVVLFRTARDWFLLLQVARWVVVPVLANLLLDGSETNFILAFAYCALPLGILIAKPFWQRCRAEKYVKNIPLCLFFTVIFTAMQLSTEHSIAIFLLRFLSGVALAPLMPWTQREYLKFHLQANGDDRADQKNKGKAALMGHIQRQQRLGMAMGLILGSFCASNPLLALSISAICYLYLGAIFIHQNYKGQNTYVSD